ncbi:MAG: HypC/HybG/HupF family hydrogenase formation chaperone [Planctomycetota bacterium]
MCLAVPGKVVEWIDRDALTARAIVEFESVRREAHMACVPDANVNDYVLIHAGVAIATIDESEAIRLSKLLIELNETDVAPTNTPLPNGETLPPDGALP